MSEGYYITIRKPGKTWRCVAKLDDLPDLDQVKLPSPEIELSVAHASALRPALIHEYEQQLAGKEPRPGTPFAQIKKVAPERWLALLIDTRLMLDKYPPLR